MVKNIAIQDESKITVLDPVLKSNDYHIPVLFNETIEGLNIQPDGIYVDCTYGGGGHSKGILNKLSSKGRLVAFDQDIDAQTNREHDERILFIPQNFRHIQKFLRLHQIKQVDGILADLGVSSHQFDEGERGFSIRFSGPMDMRMDQRQTITAASIIKDYTELQLHKIFEQYGEVSNSKTLAKQIVQQRKHLPFANVEQFKALISSVVMGNPNKYLAQVFQALRIEVNDEMGALNELMQQLPFMLKMGGRAAIITFHSIEDRMVKNFFKSGNFDEQPENPFLSVTKKEVFRLINKKPIIAGDAELKRNTRSRSAKLRIAERVGE
jgi:16S rRNA (cytosine1402-N4)-methyltransferase